MSLLMIQSHVRTGHMLYRSLFTYIGRYYYMQQAGKRFGCWHLCLYLFHLIGFLLLYLILFVSHLLHQAVGGY